MNAISAVAKREMHGREYIAGLFRSDLPEGLDWFVSPGTNGENLRTRPESYRAPSWSWAAVDSKVEFWSRTRTRSSGDRDLVPRYAAHEYHHWNLNIRGVRKIKADATLVHPELRFGPVKDASITFKTHVTTVKWIHHSSGQCQVVTGDGCYFPAYPDTSVQISTGNDDANNPLQAICIIGAKGIQRCGLVIQVCGSRYKRVAFFCCCREDWHESRAAKKDCDRKFRNFKTAEVTIV